MGTVYITQEYNSFIGKTDERLTVKADKKKLLDVPLIKIDGLVIMGQATISPAIIKELLERKIPLSFVSATGKYEGCLQPELTKNIFIRKAQWLAAGETATAIHLVRGFVRGKLKNYRHLLMRRRREYPELNLDTAITKLEQAIAPIDLSNNIDSLRGLEGAGSAAYFGCFDRLIQNPNFNFKSRVRRPPTDPVNSLLSLGYSLLRHDLQSAVNIVGFDPYLGYLHYQRYGRPSLALDLMEEFRPLVVDAIVLNAINKEKLTPNDFTSEPISNAVSLTKEGLKVFLRLYEQKKQSVFKHPVLKRQCTYQEAFEIQARLIAKYLMEETDKYPPLILK
ncbi:CRISPR-associated protein, Cas1 family (plasmid) [Stanieria cyanosphaera PCC 7437]|uniref:CRISPR-associated endonuclease Cas1 n=1 Tax=Stanieria cyanosphaera (strain ATCC 29371 / PCC 7437) TaxID=111780 RepID=K9XZG3_STAC7|nr:type I-D CRISPR-associated endonuclease Cas1d [Stanieria cyanosphaera]AFZ37985.1 CRISPR-associated protein, Cas1 family [Stanieria cyanosphaera PCC 7437]